MSEQRYTFLGIDPGLGGAFAALGTDGHVLELHDTPTLETTSSRGGKRRDYDIPAMRVILGNACLGDYGHALAVLEESQSMPGQGVRSTHTTGMGFGIWRGILGTLGVPYIRVRPAVWKRRMELSSDKEAVRLRAIELFPQADLRRKKDHGRSEALFLALYARRLHAAEVAL